MTADSPTLACRDDAMVDRGAEAPKPCLSPEEMRTLTAADDLLPAGTASTSSEDHVFLAASFFDSP